MLKIVSWKINKIIPYGKNPRIHDTSVERMAETINAFGFQVPVLLKKDGNLIDGHLRLKAAQLLGMKEVPAIEVDGLSEPQIQALRIAANKSSTFAQWDFNLLADEMEALKLEEIDLAITGFDPAELSEVFRITQEMPGGGAESSIGRIARNGPSVRVVLPVEILKIFEETLAATGEMNRAEAVKKICEAYRGKKG
ncbi:ParB N-terminal domain-containing protein [Desulfovibrio sp. OttesenSCG-928-A18]|nr:ParB N-terminal domain-containing protein [Desulfovibrio sp. OttesenSCG-928-A18]